MVVAAIRTAEREEEGTSAPVATAPDPDDTGGRRRRRRPGEWRRMKFFIDTANIDEIREAARLGIVDGVTTNPSLVAKEGRKFEAVIAEICAIVDGPISAEVTALDYDGMMAQAHPLAKIHKNIDDQGPADQGRPAGVQGAARRGHRTSTSRCASRRPRRCSRPSAARRSSRPFVGRLDDVSQDGMELIRPDPRDLRQLRLHDPDPRRVDPPPDARRRVRARRAPTWARCRTR